MLTMIGAINISIHAPAQGATVNSIISMPSQNNFNPRSRTGSDLHGNCTTAGDETFQSTLPHRERHN